MRRRNDPWDKPWVSIAAVVGVIAVVIIALVFFMSGGNNGGQAAPAPVTTPQATTAPSGTPVPSAPTASTGINPEAIREVPTATVPADGAYVRVNYIGAFAGTYGINGEMVNTKDSGDRVFPLNGTTGAVSATFHKEDGSTRHEILLEVYKNGKAVKFATNASAFGVVSVSTQV